MCSQTEILKFEVFTKLCGRIDSRLTRRRTFLDLVDKKSQFLFN